jgi:hypothetical protein
VCLLDALGGFASLEDHGKLDEQLAEPLGFDPEVFGATPKDRAGTAAAMALAGPPAARRAPAPVEGHGEDHEAPQAAT